MCLKCRLRYCDHLASICWFSVLSPGGCRDHWRILRWWRHRIDLRCCWRLQWLYDPYIRHCWHVWGGRQDVPGGQHGKRNVPLARYVKLRFAHAPGMPGTFSPPARASDPDMHHGTCVTHVPWCMPGSLTSGFLWSRWRGIRSRQ